MAEQSNPVRRDVFSVKVWDSSCDDFCHQHMTTNRETARKLATSARRELRETGRPELVKIVHPRESVASAFLSFGNRFR